MKTLISLSILATLAFHPAVAQNKQTSSAFESAMRVNIRIVDTASTTATLINAANNFERIANTEKNKWEPFYYASYCYAVMAFMQSDKSQIDAIADKAEVLLQKAQLIDNNNSEITCLGAMITSCRIMVDPVSRFQTKGREVQQLLAKAVEQNAKNPRIYLLQARMQMRTPEAFGGGKKVAKPTIEKAIEMFNHFVPASSIAPDWGKGQAVTLSGKLNG